MIIRRLLPALAVSLLMASCTSPGDEPTLSSTAATSSTTSSTSSTAESSTPTTAASEDVTTPATEPAEQAPAADPPPVAPAAPPAPAPVQQESIFNSPGVGVQCPGTDAWVDDLSLCTPANLGGEPLPADPAPAPADEFPYPTSGEAQAHYGCQQGYITDPAICDEMFAKYGR